MLPFLDVVKSDMEAVNQLIITELNSDVGLVEEIGTYLIAAGGKRLRPIVALLSARACGHDGDRHVLLATVVELIHTATLLHDDVVDTSDLRRGRHTANNQYGNAATVLVGDFLYSRAFQLMVRIGNMAVMRVLADTTNTISEGEVQQLLNAGNAQLDEPAYTEVIRKKTAELFQAAAQTGALLGGADTAVVAALRNYGHHLGMAFQLVDDALDYGGDAGQLGKNIGDDLAEGKMTLPLIRALRTASVADATLIRAAIANRDGAVLPDVLRIVGTCGALDYTLAAARQQVDRALAALAPLPASPQRQALRELAEFAANRNF
ncbi:MAG: polyprenyl synthetase family protein [Porticoccaceae bacterium]